MRLATSLLALALAASPAIAADMAAPVLRGAMPAVNDSIDWNGFYFGGFGGFKQLEHEARSSGQGLVRDMLRSSVFLNTGAADDIFVTRRTATNRTGFGIFTGYNFTYEEVVLGLEGDYGKTKLKGETTAGRNGRFMNGNEELQYFTRTNASVNITDYGSLRARVGIPFGNIMPFASAGLAVSRARYENGARLDWERRVVDPTTGAVGPWQAGTPITNGSSSKIRFGFGYALSAGVDFAIGSNLFLRAEALHYNFGNIGDQRAVINAARAGAALKF
jgi:outer membrane immunogenic protein